MKVRVRVLVSGRVQGVFFRDTTRQLALDLDVKGWVKNLDDGRLEAVFEGERKDVERMIDYCRRGPSGAKVKNVRVYWEEYKGEFPSFEVRY